MHRPENKMVRVLIAGAMVLGWFTWSGAANLENVRPYDVEEGKVEYKLTGMTKGSEVLEFKDWGRKTARRTKTTFSVMGMTQTTDQLTILDGEWIYVVDPSKNTATKVKNPILANLSEKGDKSLRQTGEDMMKAMGGKVVGKDTILGKPCEWWEIQQLMSKSCIWKGINLKTIAGVPGMEVAHTAVNIELRKIPNSRVSLPQNVKVVKGEDPFKQMREFQSQSRGQQRPRGTKDMEGSPSGPGQGHEMPDMQQMMEQIKKMQEEMQKRGFGTQ